jgi:uncharacterized membrane protein
MSDKLLKRLTNTKTIISIVSLAVLILTTWGVNIPVDKIDVTVKALCSIGVLIGVFNDSGMSEVKWNK